MYRIKKVLKEHRHITTILEYVVLLIGCLIVAISFNILLLPNQTASGGVIGLSIITKTLFGFNPAFVQWVINIPIFAAGFLILGSRIAVKTVVGSLVLPLFIYLTQSMTPLTHSPLLGSLYGGLGLGLGLGLVFRSRGSTGGFAVLALIIKRFTPISLGTATMVMDAIVIIVAGFVFNPEYALYALIVVFIMSKTIDMIQIGFNLSKIMLVISERHEEIAEKVLYQMSRGVTKIQTAGAFSNVERPMLMIVIDQSEVTRMKKLVEQTDPQAFLIISNAREVMGLGFSKE